MKGFSVSAAKGRGWTPPRVAPDAAVREALAKRLAVFAARVKAGEGRSEAGTDE